MKTSKKEKKRLIIISFMIVSLIVVLITSSFSDWSTIMENNSKLVSLENQYNELINAERSLSSEVTKLKDPEYVARYAKEKYLYSTDGEVIIRMD